MTPKVPSSFPVSPRPAPPPPPPRSSPFSFSPSPVSFVCSRTSWRQDHTAQTLWVGAPSVSGRPRRLSLTPLSAAPGPRGSTHWCWAVRSGAAENLWSDLCVGTWFPFSWVGTWGVELLGHRVGLRLVILMILFIYLFERVGRGGRKGGRDAVMHGEHGSVASRTPPTGDRRPTCSPDTCPDLESNQRPFTLHGKPNPLSPTGRE